MSFEFKFQVTHSPGFRGWNQNQSSRVQCNIRAEYCAELAFPPRPKKIK